VLWVLYDRILSVSPRHPDDSASSTHGWPGGIATRFTRERWSTRTVDGRDHDALAAALTAPHHGRPHVVVAVTEPKS
jgi:transketolase